VRRPRTIACGAAGACVIGTAVTAVPVASCTTSQCDSSTAHFNGGHMIDDSTYETNGVDEDWIPYPPNVTLMVDYSSVVGANRVIVWIDPYIGISKLPNQPDSNFINASGAVVEYVSWSGTGFRALNTTCASYFARFVVHFAPVSGDDAGAEGAP
jgi:hypothetical protein